MPYRFRSTQTYNPLKGDIKTIINKDVGSDRRPNGDWASGKEKSPMQFQPYNSPKVQTMEQNIVLHSSRKKS